jgi:hypothetical protein
MRNNTRTAFSRLPAAGFILLFFCGCFKDRVTKTYTYTITRPVYALKADVLSAINGNPGQSFDSIGKIYVKGTTIFLSEINKGIHIIDNSDPAHPLQTAFLNIPGNEDMAIKDNTLYADMYTDMLAVDISNPRQVHITGMIPNLFPNEGYLNGYYVDSNVVITSWITKDTTVTVDTRTQTYPWNCPNCAIPLAFASNPAANSSVSSTGTGTGGSMAKMTLINNYLYVISESHSMGIINVSQSPSPSLTTTMPAGFDLETIFPFGNKLFLGSAEGVYIYDVSNPANPAQEGKFTHGSACDPVITDGKYAYVTLHSGTYCGGASNELDIVDVQNLNSPVPVMTYPMTRPQGLCKDGNLLFVCDGSTGGVKVYDAHDPANLQLLTDIGQTNAYDVIAADRHLLVVAADGLYQYDYSDPQHVSPLSFFGVK